MAQSWRWEYFSYPSNLFVNQLFFPISSLTYNYVTQELLKVFTYVETTQSQKDAQSLLMVPKSAWKPFLPLSTTAVLDLPSQIEQRKLENHFQPG